MGIQLSKSVVAPTGDCCDKLVMCVLNGCKSECVLSKWCTCKIEVVNHSDDDCVVDETNNEKLLFNYYLHQEYLLQMYLICTLYFTII